MIHRGEVVEKAVRASGMPLTEIAKRLKVNRMTLYNKFDEANLSLDFIIEIGKIINYDFGNDLRELEKPNVVYEKGPYPIPTNLEDCRNELLKKIMEVHSLKEENYNLYKTNSEISKKYIKLLEERDKWRSTDQEGDERKTG